MAPNGDYCTCGMGESRRDLDARRKEEQQVQQELRAAALLQKRSSVTTDGIPAKFKPFTFESYRAAVSRNYGDGDDSKIEALGIVTQYSRNFHVLNFEKQPIYMLLMTGSVGTGKTGLTIPVLKAGIKAGLKVSYIDFALFMSECHASDLQTKERAILNLCSLDLLVIDDLGTAERTNGSALKPEAPDTIRVATEIVNARIQNFRPTIITTNLDAAGLGYQFGLRLASRLFESSVTVWVGGRDMRRDGQRL